MIKHSNNNYNNNKTNTQTTESKTKLEHNNKPNKKQHVIRNNTRSIKIVSQKH